MFIVVYYNTRSMFLVTKGTGHVTLAICLHVVVMIHECLFNEAMIMLSLAFYGFCVGGLHALTLVYTYWRDLSELSSMVGLFSMPHPSLSSLSKRSPMVGLSSMPHTLTESPKVGYHPCHTPHCPLSVRGVQWWVYHPCHTSSLRVQR